MAKSKNIQQPSSIMNKQAVAFSFTVFVVLSCLVFIVSPKDKLVGLLQSSKHFVKHLALPSFAQERKPVLLYTQVVLYPLSVCQVFATVKLHKIYDQIREEKDSYGVLIRCFVMAHWAVVTFFIAVLSSYWYNQHLVSNDYVNMVTKAFLAIIIFTTPFISLFYLRRWRLHNNISPPNEKKVSQDDSSTNKCNTPSIDCISSELG